MKIKVAVDRDGDIWARRNDGNYCCLTSGAPVLSRSSGFKHVYGIVFEKELEFEAPSVRTYEDSRGVFWYKDVPGHIWTDGNETLPLGVVDAKYGPLVGGDS